MAPPSLNRLLNSCMENMGMIQRISCFVFFILLIMALDTLSDENSSTPNTINATPLQEEELVHSRPHRRLIELLAGLPSEAQEISHKSVEEIHDPEMER
jgi:hypothetical protein